MSHSSGPWLWCLFLTTVLSAPIEQAKPRRTTPTLLISFDGFRADYLNDFLRDNPDSYLQTLFVEGGVKAEYMVPSFPSLTFPNHFTLVTGQYMESHGITGNSFYDADYKEKVNLIKDKKAADIRFWNSSEPIWESAKKQGLKTASFFWTGSDVWGKHPDIFMKYTNTIKFESRCDEIVNWFNKFELDLATLYFNEPDHTGHEYGPESEQYKNQIKAVDEVVGYLMSKLAAQNLLAKINILIVSDHGLAQMNNSINLSDYLDMSLIDTSKTTFGIVSNIYPWKDNLEKLYTALKTVQGIDVYYKDEVPERLHYSKSNRIGPIVAIAHEGNILSKYDEPLKGEHGFDNQVESMRAIFLARGPDFNVDKIIGPVNNVDVYPLLCHLVNMQCNPNNGTLSHFVDALINPPNPENVQKNLNMIKMLKV